MSELEEYNDDGQLVDVTEAGDTGNILPPPSADAVGAQEQQQEGPAGEDRPDVTSFNPWACETTTVQPVAAEYVHSGNKPGVSVDEGAKMWQQILSHSGLTSDEQLCSALDGLTPSEITEKLESQQKAAGQSDEDFKLWQDILSAHKSSAVDQPDAVDSLAATRYRMDHGRRGTLIVIDNEFFVNADLAPRREGTKVDVDRLKQAFGTLGFEVRVYSDQTVQRMLQIMEDAAKEDHSACDCFGVVVLTHGASYDVLYGTDGITTVDEFVEPIKYCKSLYGKPKLFFFQACRGEKLCDAVVVEDDGPVDADPSPKRIPREADFVYAYSTPPKCFAWRNNLNGSWFIQSLCTQLEKHFKTLDLVRILTRVNYDVAYTYESKCPGHPHLDRMRQVPSVVSMLTKELYFV